jgi:hypothetical protein
MADLLTVTGIPELTQKLQQFAAEVPPLLAIALQQEADAILAASQPLVPVDTGALVASGTVLDAQLAGAVASVEITYGGSGAGFARAPELYAIQVHFDTAMRHPHGGQAFFLQQPFFEATAGMAERLADAVRVVF